MRFCFLCSEYPPSKQGGIGTFTQSIGRALVQRGHDVHVVGMYSKDDSAPDYEEDNGVRVWRQRMGTGRINWIGGRMRLFSTVAQWVAVGKVDLVEVPDYGGMAAGWPSLPIPVVARLNNSMSHVSYELKRRLRKSTFWIERFSLRRAAEWIAVSQYIAEGTRRLFRLTNRQVTVLHNFVEIPVIGSLPRSGNSVVFAGTLNHNKGIYPLLRAWEQVAEAHSGAELHVFGKDGKTERGESMHDYIKHNLPMSALERVCFHGHVARTEILQAFQTARVAVFPSYTEAFAHTAIEAMACGCPTIYTRRASGPELIDDGKDGLLINPQQPQDIASAVLRVLQSDNLASQLSLEGRRKVEQNFSAEIMVPRNEAFYSDLIARWRA